NVTHIALSYYAPARRRKHNRMMTHRVLCTIIVGDCGSRDECRRDLDRQSQALLTGHQKIYEAILRLKYGPQWQPPKDGNGNVLALPIDPSEDDENQSNSEIPAHHGAHHAGGDGGGGPALDRLDLTR